jgi:hypothetical protein
MADTAARRRREVPPHITPVEPDVFAADAPLHQTARASTQSTENSMNPNVPTSRSILMKLAIALALACAALAVLYMFLLY